MLKNFLARAFPRAAARLPVRLTPRVSIGMAAYGNAATTQRALEMLFASATGDFELILVDDCSPDDTLEVFREAGRWHANTRIFSFPGNLEYCESVNAFLSHARGDELLFLSNDIFAPAPYLRALLDAARRHPECGILRGCSNFVDNDSPLHNVAAPGLETQRDIGEFAAQVAAGHAEGALVDERFLVGDAFLVARRTLERIGTFDTRFVGYYGDLDYGLRAQIAGLRVVLVPSAFAYHQRDANIAYLPPEERQRKLARRHRRVGEALGIFVAKYGLQLREASVHELPWEALRQAAFDPAVHFTPPRDYSRYLVS